MNYENMTDVQKLQYTVATRTDKNNQSIFGDMIANLIEMSYDELKTAQQIVTSLYIKFDEKSEQYHGVHEHFRTQIDLIESIAHKRYGRTTFDE